MGRIYTTKMALRKALITVWLTIEPESGTPAPPSWLESQGEKYTPGWRHQTRRVAAGRSRLSRRPAVSKMSATWRTFFILLTPTQTPGVTPDNASPARRLCVFPSPALHPGIGAGPDAPARAFAAPFAKFWLTLGA